MSDPLYPTLPPHRETELAPDLSLPEPDAIHEGSTADVKDESAEEVSEIEQALQEPEHPYRDPLEANRLLDKIQTEVIKAPPRSKKKWKLEERTPEIRSVFDGSDRKDPDQSMDGNSNRTHEKTRFIPGGDEGKDGPSDSNGFGEPDLGVSVYQRVRWWLYLTEIFGRWGDRMWSFTAALFLYELFPSSMLIPAIHGLVTGLCVILLGAMIGEWVDRTARLKAVQMALVIQNSSVALGSLILTFALFYRDSIPAEWKYVCVAGFTLFSIVADCASVAMNVIVEKDWIVVIAEGKKAHLADMNATIRRIDLICQILSPIIIAQIMTFSEHYVGTIVVSVWNVISMIAEYVILLSIYNRAPKLAVKERPEDLTTNAQSKPIHRKIFRTCFSFHDGWKIYFKNRVASAGIGLAFLYMTVLSFAGVTNTYVRSQGLSESVISVMMAFGAVTGIAGTFVFPILREKIGLERTGLFALSAQLCALSLCVISIWLPGSPFDPAFESHSLNQSDLYLAKRNSSEIDTDSGKWIMKPVEELPAVIVFLLGMIGARFGLWMVDLTINQLLQENVVERERGTVGGVQNAMNRFMDMLKFILVIFLPRPETFGILIIISFLFVFCGDCCYAYYSYRTRGHLLPHCGPGPIVNGIDGNPIDSIVLNRELNAVRS